MDRKTLKKNTIIISAISQTADLGMMALYILDKEGRVPSKIKTAVNFIGVACVNVSWIIAPLTRQPKLRQPWSRLGKIMGVPLMLSGAIIAGASTWNRKIIGIETPGSLIKGGMYRYMRHPTYAAILAGSLGWTLFMGAPYAAASLPSLALQLLAGGLYEERMQLKPLFGEEYEAYRKRTPFFPRSMVALLLLIYLLSLLGLDEAFTE